MKTSIVTTSINVPTFLEKYIPNLEQFGHKDVNIIIVGDTKTPEKSFDYVYDNYQEEYLNGKVQFWDVKQQEAWVNENYPNNTRDVAFAIPYQSVRRRNFGYLRALELKSDVIITIDDDNLPVENDDWLGKHLSAFSKPMNTVFSPNKLVNPLVMLNSNHAPIYMRGYPISEIFSDEFVNSLPNKRKVVMNMGLWNNKPDVDAYTNIIYPDLKSNNKRTGFDDNYALNPGHYTPINTQNTAFLSKILPAYYLLFQDTIIYENKIDRYDDIWSGMILQRIAKTLGDTVSFGEPFTDHMRNTHKYDRDLATEFSGIALNDKITKMIIDSDLDCDDYKDGYVKMTDLLDKFTTNKFHPQVGIFFRRMVKAMRIWHTLTDRFSL